MSKLIMSFTEYLFRGKILKIFISDSDMEYFNNLNDAVLAIHALQFYAPSQT